MKNHVADPDGPVAPDHFPCCGGEGGVHTPTCPEHPTEDNGPPPDAPAGAPAAAQPAARPQLVITGGVSHIPPFGDPTVVQEGYVRTLKTDDQPYRRVGVKIGPAWGRIDAGWLVEAGAGVSYLTVENLEGTNLQRVPTREERAEISQRLIEVSVAGRPTGETVWDEDEEEEPGRGFLVPPGEVMRATPADVRTVRIRCLGGGAARATITLFPR